MEWDHVDSPDWIRAKDLWCEIGLDTIGRINLSEFSGLVKAYRVR